MSRTCWSALDPDEWRRHPLNRIGGWLILVVLWLAIAGPLTGTLLLAGAVAEIETFSSFLDDGVPDWFEWTQILVPTVGGTLLLGLMFLRVRRFAELFLALRGPACLVAIAGGAFAVSSLSWVWAVKAVLIGVEIALVVYLFRGARPNAVFNRRLRDAG